MKKAMWFDIYLLVCAIILILTVFAGTFVYKSKFKKEFGEKFAEIGDKQLKMFEAIENGEKELLHIDLAAFFSGRQAYYDLAQNGGYFNPKCGRYIDVSLWRKNNVDCTPIEPELSLFLEKYLKSYTDYNYIFVIDGPKIKGIATKSKKVEIK